MVLHIEENFEEREEKLLLKAILVWLRMRFVTPLKLKVKQDHVTAIQHVQKLEKMDLFAVITKTDAWVIEKNVDLFNLVARKYMRRVLSKEAYGKYGGITFVVNRSMNSVDVCLLPPTFKPKIQSGILPCSMFIVTNETLVKDIKKKEQQKQFDVIPFMKRNIPHFLHPEDVEDINTDFDKFKTDFNVVKSKLNIIAVKDHEDKNLEEVLTAIENHGGDSSLMKVTIMMHYQVTKAYNRDPQTILKIRYDNGPDPVKNFSQLFMVNYDIDMDSIKIALERVLVKDIKVMVRDNRMLFTTSPVAIIPDAPVDPADSMFVPHVNTIIIENEEAMSYFFNMCVGTVIAIDDVVKIVAGFPTKEGTDKIENA